MAAEFLKLLDGYLETLPENHPDRAFLLGEKQRTSRYITSQPAESLDIDEKLPDFTNDLASLLVFTRSLNNHTQQAAADKLNMGKSRYVYIENQLTQNVDNQTKRKIFTYMGLTIDQVKLLLTQIKADKESIDSELANAIKEDHYSNTTAKVGGQIIAKKRLYFTPRNSMQHSMLLINEFPTLKIMFRYSGTERDVVFDNLEKIKQIAKVPYRRFMDMHK